MAAYCETCHGAVIGNWGDGLDTGIMRLGPIFTAFLAGTLSLSFFVHEKP
jgi:hypothetical protein